MNFLAALWNRKTLVLCTAFSMLLGAILVSQVWVPKIILLGVLFMGAMTVFVMGLPRPEWVLCGLAAYLPFGAQLASDAGSFPSPYAVATWALLFMAASMTFRKDLRDDAAPWFPRALKFSLLAFFGWALISVFQAVFMKGVPAGIAFGEFYRHWVLPVLICFGVYRVIRSREAAENLTLVLISATTIIALMAIRDALNVGEVGDFDQSRVGGIANDPNILAAFLVYVSFLPLGFLAIGRKKKWIFAAVFLILLNAMLGTFSRGGYVAFAVGFYALAFFRKKILIIPLIMGSLFLVFNPQFLPESIRARMAQTVEKPTPFYSPSGAPEESLDKSNRDRIEIWKGSVRMIQEHPVFGIGYTLFRPTIRFYWPGRIPFEPHNTYLHIASEMGIPALLAFLGILAVLLHAGIVVAGASPDDPARALGLGFLGGFASLLASHSYVIRLDSIEASAYFWMLAGLILKLREIQTPRHCEDPPAICGGDEAISEEKNPDDKIIEKVHV